MTVWMVRLSLECCNSFSISATVMGMMRFSTIFAPAMITVLVSTFMVLGMEKMYSKFCSPIHF